MSSSFIPTPKTATARLTNYNRWQIDEASSSSSSSKQCSQQLASTKSTTLGRSNISAQAHNSAGNEGNLDEDVAAGNTKQPRVRNTNTPSSSSSSSRRAFVSTTLRRGGSIGALAAASLLTTAVVVECEAAHAFPNALQPDSKKYADRPKRKGTPPKDLGVAPRTIETANDGPLTLAKLRSCDGNPNCFSTTGDELLSDRQQYGVDYYIPEWQPPVPSSPPNENTNINNNIHNNSNTPTPIETIAEVMTTYEPGQGGIDGGGYILVKKTDTYLYYQFESLKKGYIDDLEFAMVEPAASSNNNNVMVRSASRVGITDFGVNAIRLNYIAAKLTQGYGWTIPDITPETHRDYWITADEAREATFNEDRRRLE